MAKKNSDNYIYAVGRRKTAVATVRLYEGDAPSTINGKEVDKVYPRPIDKRSLNLPFSSTGTENKFFFTAKTAGGGVTGQLEAIRLGIARALVEYSKDYRSDLKSKGLLTRDARMVERKKPGLKKARKSPQFSKR